MESLRKKNVILIDMGNLGLIDHLADMNINVICYYTGNGGLIKNEILSHYPNIKNLYYDDEAAKWTNTWVSQSDIKKYYSTQVKVERAYHRATDNNSDILTLYYNSLAFWLNIINTKVDCLIVTGIEHGSCLDTLPLDIAKSLSIPSFIIELNFDIQGNELYAIKCHNHAEYINLTKLQSDVTRIKLREIILKDRGGEMTNLPTSLPKITKRLLTLNIKIYTSLSHIYKKITGNKKCLRDESKSAIILMIKLYIILSAGIRFISRRGYKINFNDMGIVTYDPLDYIIGWKNIHKYKKYYEKNSKKSIPSEEKFVLYALHFEPEARILSRTVYNNQIYNIKMLASALPEGWKLYVKEHPDQFNIYFSQFGLPYFHYISHYRNINYYKEILSTKNVYLLDCSISSKSLFQNEENENTNKHKIKGDLMAVATINGSIALECLEAKKPLFLFDADSTCASILRGALSITSYTDLQDFFQKLTSNNRTIIYDDPYTYLAEYLMLKNNETGKLQITREMLSKLIENTGQEII